MARARANWEGAYDVSHVLADDGAEGGARAGWVGRRGEYYSVHEDTTIGWDEKVGVNECVDKEGRFVPAGTFKALSGGPPMPDPRAPARRAFDDPSVVALREELRAKNGLADIEICEPHELDRIERLFRRDGVRALRRLLVALASDPNVGLYSSASWPTCSARSNSTGSARAAAASSRRSWRTAASTAASTSRRRGGCRIGVRAALSVSRLHQDVKNRRLLHRLLGELLGHAGDVARPRLVRARRPRHDLPHPLPLARHGRHRRRRLRRRPVTPGRTMAMLDLDRAFR